MHLSTSNIKKAGCFLLICAALSGNVAPVRADALAAAPVVFSQDTMDFYQAWKENYVVQDTYVTDEVQYYVWYSGDAYADEDLSVPVTVSEAHGYGMLIFASMAQEDAAAKDYFDGMYRYYKAHPSSIAPHLMSWQQCDNGTALIDGAYDGLMTGGYANSATDGDMDIAYALLLADSMWGSSGDIDYHSEAVAVIQDIMHYDVNQKYWTLTLGDWVSECTSADVFYHATRTSDFMLSYLPVFAEVTGDENWLEVYDTTYGIITEITAEYGNGVLPDFVVRNADGTYSASPADFLESAYDGSYYYNACRTPWRISMDSLVSGNATARAYAKQISDFMKTASGNEPLDIMAGYHLDGTAFETYSDLCFIAPVLVAAKSAGDTQWHDTLRASILNYGEDIYYGDTLRLLCLMTDDGSYRMLKASYPCEWTLGDVNEDGQFDILDAVLMQKYLHGRAALSNVWQAGDFDEDGKITIYDFCLMKQALLN